MASWSIGDVEAFLGLSASTLRHWEKAAPMLCPRKDRFGRRVYSDSDVRLLLRLRHLALERGLGIGAAGRLLIEEGGTGEGPLGEFRSRLAELRGELISLWLASARCGKPRHDKRN